MSQFDNRRVRILRPHIAAGEEGVTGALQHTNDRAWIPVALDHGGTVEIDDASELLFIAPLELSVRDSSGREAGSAVIGEPIAANSPTVPSTGTPKRDLPT